MREDALIFVVRHQRGYVGLRGDRVVVRWYGLWDLWYGLWDLLSARRIRGQEHWITVSEATVTIDGVWLRVSWNGAPWVEINGVDDVYVAQDFASEVKRLRRRALGDPDMS